ncbi:sulfatase-like hydrolase/transferase [Paenibacillus rhizovicinus]|uniref:Sulfatase-like hydrolase/transferase n=1 Tax=Paenibacillus rhizovicinus TaxID=2704463 RepID=A0A6C0P4L3_9BACL|nr:sulfatase-like hydrolase/transferase [Paenibacillus rhizovicinus]QHW33468.1 sulfatase-like hydrolase/transferase [Paenibacillus rhizovicinus]
MRRPNLIVIYCDDLGYGDLGCYGSEDIQTPHLDRLAEEGVRFTNWYSNSPVCSPSRASLLTGRYPARTGVERILSGKRGTAGLPLEQKTIASVLKPEGYRTGLFGKWHLGVTPEQSPNAHGFDEFFGFLAGCVDYYSHIFYWEQRGGVNPVHDLWHNDREVWSNGEYLTELITAKTVAFIEAGRELEQGDEQEQPFFAYAAYNAPHYPMHAPQKYVDRYPRLPPDKRIMAAMISAVDDGVGEIVEALRRTGQYENTVIFFSSDNGPSTESRNYLDGTEDLYYGGSAGIFRGHKGSLFEGGIREPAIMSYPSKVSSGRVEHRPHAMMDVLPTFLELAGIESPAVTLDGRSAAELLLSGNGPQAGQHERLFWSYEDQLAVREGSWKLVLNGKLDFGREAPDAVHLSNLETDPGERSNLSLQFPDKVRELREAVIHWYEQSHQEGR